MEKSYFPIKIEIILTGEIKIVEDPKDIPLGISFKVLETNCEK